MGPVRVWLTVCRRFLDASRILNTGRHVIRIGRVSGLEFDAARAFAETCRSGPVRLSVPDGVPLEMLRPPTRSLDGLPLRSRHICR